MNHMQKLETDFSGYGEEGNYLMSDRSKKSGKINLVPKLPDDVNMNARPQALSVAVLKNPHIQGALIGVIPSAILFLVTLFAVVPYQINHIEDDLDDISGDISTLQNLIIAESAHREQAVIDLGKRIDSLYSAVPFRTTYQPTPEFSSCISLEYNGKDQPTGRANNLLSNSFVVYDTATEEQYTVSDLSYQKLLLPYTNGNQEIFFYGQFNEDGNWDGRCILNVYENNNLVLITDAEYSSGVLLNCRQIYPLQLRSGQNVWAYSDREHDSELNVNVGVTWYYLREDNYYKSFDLENVSSSDILCVDSFRAMNFHQIHAYYSGHTSEGYLNDTTGNAYMVYFFENGTVRLLYSGNFVDGTFNDITGNAWQIAKEVDTDYMYYQGHFNNGYPTDNPGCIYGHPPLTQEKIDSYLSQRPFSFPFDLKWDIFPLI